MSFPETQFSIDTKAENVLFCPTLKGGGWVAGLMSFSRDRFGLDADLPRPPAFPRRARLHAALPLAEAHELTIARERRLGMLHEGLSQKLR